MSTNIKFKIGDKVMVISECECCGQIGIVKDICCYGHDFNYVMVRLDNGWFRQYRAESLRLLKENEGGNGMSISGNYNVAFVKFLQGVNTTKEYAFALFEKDGSICVGDLVLCDTINGYYIARVSRITTQTECDFPVTKEIVCKVDFTNFERRKELRRQKELLKQRMDKMVAENQELILYQAIADKNPEMAEMLADYKALSDI